MLTKYIITVSFITLVLFPVKQESMEQNINIHTIKQKKLYMHQTSIINSAVNSVFMSVVFLSHQINYQVCHDSGLQHLNPDLNSMKCKGPEVMGSNP